MDNYGVGIRKEGSTRYSFSWIDTYFISSLRLCNQSFLFLHAQHATFLAACYPLRADDSNMPDYLFVFLFHNDDFCLSLCKVSELFNTNKENNKNVLMMGENRCFAPDLSTNCNKYTPPIKINITQFVSITNTDMANSTDKIIYTRVIDNLYTCFWANTHMLLGKCTHDVAKVHTFLFFYDAFLFYQNFVVSLPRK